LCKKNTNKEHEIEIINEACAEAEKMMVYVDSSNFTSSRERERKKERKGRRDKSQMKKEGTKA